MKQIKDTLLFLIFLYATSLAAQDNTTYTTTINNFQAHFNTQDIDAVFGLYSSEMQEEITKEGVTRFVKGCHEQFGNLKNITFIESTEGVNRYTAEFDKTNFIMELMLTPEGKIITIQFQEP